MEEEMPGGAPTNKDDVPQVRNEGESLVDDTAQLRLVDDDVLHKIMEMCPWREMKVWRQVNHEWYRNSLKRWLKTAPPLVLNVTDSKDGKSVSSFLQRIIQGDDDDTGSNGEFGDIGLEGLRQVRKFKIVNHNHFEDCSPVNTEKVVSLLEHCGQNITHLELEKITFTTLSDFLDVIYCLHTPKLEVFKANMELDLDRTPLDARKYEEMAQIRGNKPHGVGVNASLKVLSLYIAYSNNNLIFPLNWKHFLLSFPNLKDLSFRLSLSWDFLGRLEGEEVYEVLQAIQEIRRTENPHKLNLTRLDLLNCFSDYKYGRISKSPTLSFLRDTKLELESLSLVWNSDREPQEQMALCTLLSSSLKKLKIYMTNEPWLYLQASTYALCKCITSLENLTHLTLIGGACRLFHLGRLPQLQCVKLRRCVHGHGHAVDMDGPISEAFGYKVMTHLNTFFCDYGFVWSSRNIRNLAQFAPNLKHIGLALNNRCFTEVCAAWLNLESLHVYEDHLTDVGFTGIQTLGPINQLLVDVRRSWANITSLPELRSFTMEVFKKGNKGLAVRLTEKSVLQGLLMLPKLDMVEIAIGGDCREAIQALRNKVNLVRVRTVYKASRHPHYDY